MRNTMRLGGITIIAACAFVVLGGAGSTQEKDNQPPEVKGPAKDGLPKQDAGAKVLPAAPANNGDIQWVEMRPGILIAAAVQIQAIRNPMAVCAVRLAAADNPLMWPEWEVSLEAPLPLSSKLLHDIRDDTLVPSLQGKPISDLKDAERAYYLLTCEALVNSTLVPFELFKKAGEENRWVTFDHLFKNPALYRGKVVTVTGRMIRLRKWEAPRKAQESGVDFCYEGWVVGPTPGRNPYCIVFTTMPEGLTEAETMDRPITFYGYSIRMFRYPAANTERRTNLLIGPTVILEKTPPVPPAQIFSRDVLFATIGGIFAIGVALALMLWWFRRGDRAVHAELQKLRDQPLVLGPADESTPPNQEEPFA